MNDWAKRIIELAKESNSVRFVFEPSDGEVYRQTNLEPAVVSALCERLLAYEKAVERVKAIKCQCKYKPYTHQYVFTCQRCECLEELEKDIHETKK